MLLRHFGQNVEQLLFAGVVGIVAEQFDAVVQTVVGEEQRESLEITVDPSFVGGLTNGAHQTGIVELGSLHARDVLDCVLALLVEGLVAADDLGVFETTQSAIEE